MTQITLATLFRGTEETLDACLEDVLAGQTAQDIATKRVEPVLERLEINAGMPMDPTFVVYMIMAATIQAAKARKAHPHN